MLIDYQKVSIYQADKCVLKEINFHVDEGEFTYLIGKVGSGKSSLLKTLYCELDLVEGETEKAEILGRDHQAKGNTSPAQGTGYYLPGFPVAPRPYRTQELRVCTEGYRMERQEGKKQANRRSAKRSGHDREDRQVAT